MSKLFILGNGFDRAHGLPTSYEDFRKYLVETYPKADALTPTYDVSIRHMPNGEIGVDNNEAVAFIINAINNVEEEKWCNVESKLADLHVPLEDFLSDLEDLFDLDDDKELTRNVHRNEDASSAMHQVMLKFHNVLVDWVQTIDINKTSPKPKEKFKKLIDSENDYFLTFNYTYVLEDIYGADGDNVCHIHGAQYDCASDIFFGHGDVREDFETCHIGATESLQKIHKVLEKDTHKALRRAKYFFDELSSVHEIYSHGFSFSPVDLIYLEQICKICNTEKCTWYLSDYESVNEKDSFKNRIREAGFKGDFKEFAIQ
ncbi:MULTISPECIES: bacteriophage abortive infection AbiH family protein [Bacillus cereus group]|uniref:bacteriophage abortive infection AbiH family protein n=1 Tax=Bacillus cereus group TaxID=86661 RepID=UPI000BEF76D2|nr:MULTISPECIES: bacteriophage abortive infection AbiH family protein [Bacillus cereus group]MBJ8044265.1 bacteriophage abortive infection AbiH family protein [Bacillus cereus group sp. N17]PEJ00636.1 hypothetical protein CN671_19320 [Bacillus toyonensis]PFZ67540.1 hypothetical protein COL72_28365 [Bacillus toyonensis]HDR3908604.1 bacteriophage abortive infection AbiH family protein [Bacillus toyonensis]HDR7409212.1 bacteriophage abortive infection AbiH family protein [Bacillus toyonensis]